jgi:hypothetical protein
LRDNDAKSLAVGEFIYFGTDANGKNKVNFAVGKIMNPWW